MTNVSSPLWSLFLVIRRNSSSLIHIKPNKTSFFDGLSLSKRLLSPYLFCFICDLRVFRYYYLFCFLFFVLILFWFDLTQVFDDKLQRDFKQRKNQDNQQTLRNLWLISQGVRNFALPANQFCTLCKNKPTLRNHFEHSVKFSQSMRKISHTKHHFAQYVKT